MKKKIKKVTPIKSDTLCRKCVYSFEIFCAAHECEYCERRKDVENSLLSCACNLINDGEKCEDFKRRLPTVQIGNYEIIFSKDKMNFVFKPKDDTSEVKL